MRQDSTFGKWLKLRRTELGVTQDELSERLRISVELLRKMEAGERRPSGQIAHLLADYFLIPDDEREAFVTFARTGGVSATSANSIFDLGGTSPTAPWRRAYVHRTNLPAVLTPLIGREREIAAGRDLLLDPRTRLLTLTGAPGIGKTSLAVQVASDVVEHFEDGVYFVDLSPVSEPEQILVAVARLFELKEGGGRTLGDTLIEHLREKRMLLVLDNFEQVLDAAPEVVGLLQAGRWLKVLVTSREPLYVRGEKRYSIPPLALPDLSRLPPVDELLTYPSVELFVERAGAVVPDFIVDESNVGAVAQICSRLGGLPLAIELVAARVRLFTPNVLLARLEQVGHLRISEGGARDLPARQRSLREAIAWSYNLLRQAEKALFRRLGVFAGGFTPEAAGAVWGAENEDDAPDVMELLLSFTDKSLVKQLSPNGAREEIRFGMLEMIREFAEEHLEEHEEIEEARQRHAYYFTKLAEQSEIPLSGADQAFWLGRLEAEHENFLAALRWSISSNPEVGLRLAGALKHFWWIRGYFSEGRDWLEAALESCPVPMPLVPSSFSAAPAGSQSPSPETALKWDYRARALYGAGTMASDQADYAAARAFYEEGLAIERAWGNKKITARLLAGLGVVASDQGEFAQARAFHEESLAVSQELGDSWGVASALTDLGFVAYMQEDYAAMRSLFEESLVIWRELGEMFRIAQSVDHLGVVNMLEGNYAEARPLFQEGLAIQRQLGHKWGIAASLEHLANLTYMEGDDTGARPLYKESLIIQREIGSKKDIARVLCELADLDTAIGNATRGAKLLGVVAELCEAINIRPGAEAHFEYQRSLASAREQLGDEAFQKAWSEGRALTIEEAIAYLLDK